MSKADARMTWRTGDLSAAVGILQGAVSDGDYSKTLEALDGVLQLFSAEELARLLWERRMTDADADLVQIVEANMSNDQFATEVAEAMTGKGRAPTMLDVLRDDGYLPDTDQAQRTLEAAHDAEGHGGPVTWCAEAACKALSDLQDVA